MRRDLIMVIALLVGACASEGGAGSSESVDTIDVFETTIGLDSGDVITTSCPPAHVLGPGGDCIAVGIQGCADLFINPHTGLCEPKPEDCPPGQIPVFSEGCQAVGIPDCHPDFIHPESGLCEPSLDLCADGFIPIPTQGCVSLDPPGGCGQGTWGHIEEQDGDIHVDVNYAGGDSDGSRHKPWTLISDAFEHSETFEHSDAFGKHIRVVLAAGEYNEGVNFPGFFDEQYQPTVESVALVGRCSSMVSITGAFNGHNGKTVVQIMTRANSLVSDVTISGPGFGIVVWGTSSELTRVVVDGAHPVGILVPYPVSSLVATDILVARTVAMTNGSVGRGLEASDGSSVTLKRAVIAGNNQGIWLGTKEGNSSRHTRLRIDDSLVTYDTGPPDPSFGLGMLLGGALSAHVTNTAVVGTRHSGIIVRGHKAKLLLENAVVSRTQLLPSNPVGSLGVGLSAYDGARASLSSVALFDNQSVGVLIRQEATSVVAHSLLVAETTLGSGESHGLGVSVQGGASFKLDTGSIVHNHSGGIVVREVLSEASVRSALVADTAPNPMGLYGHGIQASSNAVLMVDQTMVLRNQSLGISFIASGGQVSRSMVLDTHQGASVGDGVLITSSVVEVSRLAARGNARVGVLFDRSGGELTASLSTENLIGLINQGLPGAVVRDDNLITGNEQASSGATELEVTNHQFDLPDPPPIEEGD